MGTGSKKQWEYGQSVVFGDAPPECKLNHAKMMHRRPNEMQLTAINVSSPSATEVSSASNVEDSCGLRLRMLLCSNIVNCSRASGSIVYHPGLSYGYALMRWLYDSRGQQYTLLMPAALDLTRWEVLASLGYRSLGVL